MLRKEQGTPEATTVGRNMNASVRWRKQHLRCMDVGRLATAPTAGLRPAPALHSTPTIYAFDVVQQVTKPSEHLANSNFIRSLKSNMVDSTASWEALGVLVLLRSRRSAEPVLSWKSRTGLCHPTKQQSFCRAVGVLSPSCHRNHGRASATQRNSSLSAQPSECSARPADCMFHKEPENAEVQPASARNTGELKGALALIFSTMAAH